MTWSFVVATMTQKVDNNNNTKFEQLVVLKKGVLMDQSGMYALLLTVHAHISSSYVVEMEYRTAGFLSHFLFCMFMTASNNIT